MNSRMEIPGIERDQRIGLTIDRCLQHHLVRRITELRTPEIMQLNRFSISCPDRQQHIKIRTAQTMRLPLLWTLKHRLVLGEQRYRYKHRETLRRDTR